MIELRRERFRKGCTFDFDLEMSRQLYGIDFLLKVFGSVFSLFNKKEIQLASEIGPMCSCGLQGDDRGARLASGVTAGTRETVNVHNPAVVSRKDREPGVEIFAQDLVLGSRVRLQVPDRFVRYAHAIIRTNTLALVLKK